MANELGKVFLVGAGPGDADLLTVKALRLIQSADVILYDRLISKEIMELIPKTTEIIYVGKETSNHHKPQDEINLLLVNLAKTKRIIVRLKGGDPFIFGRGGEELLQLKQSGIDFEVVPGITAASGCCAYAGIPLTHRDINHSIIFITGHKNIHNKNGLDIEYPYLSKTKSTIVFYMGLNNLPTISSNLIKNGMRHDMPAAAIYQGTTSEQQVIISTINELADKTHNLQSPVILVVGEVVNLATYLAWFNPISSKSK